MSEANEPAYPYSTGEDRKGNSYEYSGLTKRELFAAMAMQGVLASDSRTGGIREVAEGSVTFADALLKALEEQK